MGKSSVLHGAGRISIRTRREIRIPDQAVRAAEAMAIRWHMGEFDDTVRGGSYASSDAYAKYPLAPKLHIADMYATI